jgi:hypothetical protein
MNDHTKQTALWAKFKNARCWNLSLSGPNLLVDLRFHICKALISMPIAITRITEFPKELKKIRL